MTFFFETLLGGLLAGTLYSLVAIGFVLIYKASGVFNFAQGSMLLFAALTFVSLHEQGVPFALALLLTVVVMIVGALLIERLVLRPLVNRSQITLFMATLGLSFIVEGLAQGLMGSQVRALDLGIDDVPLFVGPLMLSQFDLIAAAAAVVLVTVLALLFNKTRIGVSLRAVADDTTAALSIGINLNRIWQIVWAVAGTVGLVAGLLWGARQGVAVFIVAGGAQGLAGVDHRRLYLDWRGDCRRADCRRGGEPCRGVYRPTARRRHHAVVRLRPGPGLPVYPPRRPVRRACHRASLKPCRSLLCKKPRHCG